MEVARQECGDLLQLSAGWPTSAVELGSILLGSSPGRTSADDVTLFESQGMALLDLTAAVAVLAKTKASGVGRQLGDELAAW